MTATTNTPLEPEIKSTPVLWTALLASLACAVLALVLFAWLAEEVFHGKTQQFDTHVRSFVL